MDRIEHKLDVVLRTLRRMNGVPEVTTYATDEGGNPDWEAQAKFMRDVYGAPPGKEFTTSEEW